MPDADGRWMRLWWFIEDEDMTKTQLMAEAGQYVVDLCADLGWVPTGMARDWEIEVSGAGRPVLTCLVPVEPMEDPRRARLRRLHQQGLNDQEIAGRLGVSARTCRRWRTDLGLPSNSIMGRKAADPERQKRTVVWLHAAGLSDHEIGRRMGVAQSRVWKIRSGLGLKPNGAGGRPKKAV